MKVAIIPAKALAEASGANWETLPIDKRAFFKKRAARALGVPRAKFDEGGELVVNRERWELVTVESYSWIDRYAELCKHINAGESVLEIGCGDQFI